MSQQRFGATLEAWDHFANKLGLVADLLPVVSNPHAEISPASKMKALGKTPSVYNRDRKVIGLPEWTSYQATEHVVERWASEPDYGICLQTRSVRAFDIDVADPVKAQAIAVAIQQTTGPLPLRFRANSGKRLLGFTYHRPLTKRVIPVDSGMVEILADGQQFIAEGTHDSGVPYEWAGGWPKAFPVITGEQFDKVWALLSTIFATGEPRIAREKRQGSADPDLIVHDDVADWLVANWETYDVGSEGQVFIECPFAGTHTTDSGPTGTAYFPAGTGGFARGHFVCLHAHCTEREDQDYLDATGYATAQFQDLTGGAPGNGGDRRNDQAPANERARPSDDVCASPGSGDGALAVRRFLPPPFTLLAPPEWPGVVRHLNGKIDSTAENLFLALQHGAMVHRHICYDAFADDIVWEDYGVPHDTIRWKKFGDEHMIAVRIELEKRGFKPMEKSLLRDAIFAAAKANKIDTAVEWLQARKWDGIPRIDTFAIDCWGWADTPYARAVGAYVWTAMAGRVIQPGVQADMAVILVGVQGVRKTTALKRMVPGFDAYTEVKLNEKDDDLSRKMRGKLIGELEELRGLQTRALEEIKAFISRQREAWIPKYKEFESFFPRRLIFIGTTNEDEFLNDPTGERRWLPGHCNFLDIDRIEATRDLLWAEGAARFMLNGVEWEAAERLAPVEHVRYKISDSWEHAIKQWLETPQIGGIMPLDKGYVTVHEILSAAMLIGNAQQERRHEIRVIRALKSLGFATKVNGDGRVYVRSGRQATTLRPSASEADALPD